MDGRNEQQNLSSSACTPKNIIPVVSSDLLIMSALNIAGTTSDEKEKSAPIPDNDKAANFFHNLYQQYKAQGFQQVFLPTFGNTNFKFDLNNEKHRKTIKFLEEFAKTLAPNQESYDPAIHTNGIASGTPEVIPGMVLFKKENNENHSIDYFFHLRASLYKGKSNKPVKLLKLDKSRDHAFVMIFKNYPELPTNWQAGINIPYHIEVRIYNYNTAGHPHLVSVDDNIFAVICPGELLTKSDETNDQTGGLHSFSLQINKDPELKHIVYEVLTTLIFEGTKFISYEDKQTEKNLLEQSIFKETATPKQINRQLIHDIPNPSYTR